MIKKFASVCELQDKVQFVLGLEGVLEPDDEGTVGGAKDVPFVHSVLEGVSLLNVGLAHDFHGVEPLPHFTAFASCYRLSLYQVHFARLAAANQTDELEVVHAEFALNSNVFTRSVVVLRAHWVATIARSHYNI